MGAGAACRFAPSPPAADAHDDDAVILEAWTAWREAFTREEERSGIAAADRRPRASLPTGSTRSRKGWRDSGRVDRRRFGEDPRHAPRIHRRPRAGVLPPFPPTELVDLIVAHRKTSAAFAATVATLEAAEPNSAFAFPFLAVSYARSATATLDV